MVGRWDIAKAVCERRENSRGQRTEKQKRRVRDRRREQV